MLPLLLRLFSGQAEEEKILRPHLFADFDIGAVQGADGQGTVQRQFHVASARCLGSGGGDLLRKIGGRNDLLGQRDPVIRKKDHPQPATHGRITVDRVRHGRNELDDELGLHIGRRCFAGKNHRAGHYSGIGRGQQPVILNDDP